LLLDDARKIIAKYPLCDNCFGRQFGGLARGVTNRERGYALKLALAIEGHREMRKGNAEGEALLRALASNGSHLPAANVIGGAAEKPACYLCGGLLERVPVYAAEVVKALEGYSYSNFLIGARVAGELAEREDALRSEFAVEFGESLKMESSREIGKEVAKVTGKDVEFARPDVVVTVEIPGPGIDVKSMPLYIYGRYKKLVRGIPQSKWDCVHCGGRGCEVCHGTGKIYPISVEEIVTGPIMEAAGGADEKFHGAGREDVDAIMRGTGRPFVVEIKDARNRALDLKAVEVAINELGGGRVEVSGLRLSDKKTVRSLKEKAKVAEKSYRALVELDGEASDEALRSLEKSFNGCILNQYTPTRVMHRRADKLRLKRVHELSAKRVDDHRIELVVRCQGGLYVKELISGDEGRTKPNVAEALGCGARCIELDVIAVNEGA
jgi:tRNA pseudouridine synthase 10